MRLSFALLSLCLSFPVFAADAGKLTLTGSSTIAPLALDLGKRFEKLNPGMRVDVQAAPRRTSSAFTSRSFTRTRPTTRP